MGKRDVEKHTQTSHDSVLRATASSVSRPSLVRLLVPTGLRRVHPGRGWEKHLPTNSHPLAKGSHNGNCYSSHLPDCNMVGQQPWVPTAIQANYSIGKVSSGFPCNSTGAPNGQVMVALSSPVDSLLCPVPLQNIPHLEPGSLTQQSFSLPGQEGPTPNRWSWKTW